MKKERKKAEYKTESNVEMEMVRELMRRRKTNVLDTLLCALFTVAMVYPFADPGGTLCVVPAISSPLTLPKGLLKKNA